MTTRAAFGPLLVLAALSAGIWAGEAAGPGAARVALLGGAVGVIVGAAVTQPGLRVVILAIAFALVARDAASDANRRHAVSPRG